MRSGTRRIVLHSVILVGLIAAGLTAEVWARQRAAAAIATAAQGFLASLTPEQRASAVFPLDSDEWTRWHYVPTSTFPRKGVTLKDMTETQRQRAHDLLKVSVSQTGYRTVTGIIQHESILGALETAARNGRAGGISRDPEIYFFTVFGDPAATGRWGWRVEGHHLSLHFSVDAGRTAVTSTPLFLGLNPAEVREGPQAGLRILGAQEDTARALLTALDETARLAAIIAPTAPTDIVTLTAIKADPLSPSGLAASAMTPAQREMLLKIVEAYSATMLPEVAADRLAKMRAAGLEKIAFAWAGPIEKGQRYYYRVQGPTFLIEHNNTQNNGNHIHSVWRDFSGDFGRDLLAEHLRGYH